MTPVSASTRHESSRRRWRLVLVLLISSSPAFAAASTAGAEDARRVVNAARPATVDINDLNAIHIVIDTSASMSERDSSGRVKLEGAKSGVLQFLQGVDPAAAFGLRTYPDPRGGACNTGVLQHPVERRRPEQISESIRSLQSGGKTPTAEALEAAAEDIRSSGFPSATIFLVSDGESTCRPPCDAAKAIVASGLNLQVITAGFMTSRAGEEELRCIADVTGGRYVDIDNSDDLERYLQDLTVPRLLLEVAHPDQVVAEVGFGDDGTVTVEATVRNDGQIAAIDTTIRLQFEGQSPGVVNPVRRLGNLSPQTTTTARWTFWPGLLLAGQTVSFAVVVGAKNAPEDIGKRGEIRVLNLSTADDAGPILRGRRLAILGDSYSSGEGTSSYLPGTDDRNNACHRSRDTYLAKAFDISAERILACSGALAIDISVPNIGNGVPSQVDQLRRLEESSGPVDGVILTLGGNDAGFGKIVQACLFGDCTTRIPGGPLDTVTFQGEATDAFLLRNVLGLPASLMTAYADIHSTLNSTKSVERRSGVAPIIVLAYPRIAPSVVAYCHGPGLVAFSAEEIQFVHRFYTNLNGIIEGTVRVAREERGIPVFFVPNVEDSFMPDRSVCDLEPYARGFNSFNFDAFNPFVVLDNYLPFPDFVRSLSPLIAAARFIALGDVNVINITKQTLQELLHPNTLGYSAMTQAVIRWSLNSDAQYAISFTRDVRAVSDVSGCDWDTTSLPREVSTSDNLEAATRCALYRIVTTQAAPGSIVEVVVESTPRVLAQGTAGPDGAAELTFGFPPDLPPGRHTLYLRGVDEEGVSFERAWPVEFDKGSVRIHTVIGIAGVVLLMCGLLLLAHAVGRRRRVVA